MVSMDDATARAAIEQELRELAARVGKGLILNRGDHFSAMRQEPPTSKCCKPSLPVPPILPPIRVAARPRRGLLAAAPTPYAGRDHAHARAQRLVP